MEEGQMGLVAPTRELEHILIQVLLEVKRAQRKFPWWPEGLSDGAMIVMEEAGEVAKAAVDARWGRAIPSELRKELLHCAATCVRMIYAMDSGGGSSDGTAGG